MKELGIESALDLLYPTVGGGQCGLQDTLSRREGCQRARRKETLLGRECTFERKSMPMVAWYMLSKESYMNRVIREVLPTVYVRILSF